MQEDTSSSSNKVSTQSSSNLLKERLICKTPVNGECSASASNRNATKVNASPGPNAGTSAETICETGNPSVCNSRPGCCRELILDVSLVIFGLIIAVCGYFVYQLNLASGLWTGPIILLTGSFGIRNTAVCRSSEKCNLPALYSTWYLILCLIAFALCQLCLVLTAIALSRLDIANFTKDYIQIDQLISTFYEESFTDHKIFTDDQYYFFAQTLLVTELVCSGAACFIVAAAVYVAARITCLRSRRQGDDVSSVKRLIAGGDRHESSSDSKDDKETMLRSWLTTLPPPLATNAPLSSRSGAVYIVPTQFQTVPRKQKIVHTAPVLPNLVPVHLVPLVPHVPQTQVFTAPQYYYVPYYCTTPRKGRLRHAPAPKSKRSTSSEQDTEVTPDLSSVYTGWDRTIAEEYIECCDSRRSTYTSNST